MNNWLIAIQVIGLIGTVFGIFSFQAKHRSSILKLQLTSNVFWVLHFVLLGAVTGAGLNFIAMFRAYSFYKFGEKKKRSKRLLWLIVGLMVAVTLGTWQGFVSLLPMTGMIIATLGFWERDEQRIRLLLLAASPLWFAYNAISGSYAGMLTEIFVTVSILIALFRYRTRGQETPKKIPVMADSGTNTA